MAANKHVLGKESTTKTTFPLNYDCLFEVFQWLGLQECMNLAEAYDGLQWIADWFFKRKFNKFTFDFEDPIHRVLYHAGPSMKSLTLILDKFSFTESDLIEIRDTCKQLQCLTLNGFDRKTATNKPFGNATDTMKVLTLNNCSIANDVDFFGVTENLKCLNLVRCRDMKNIAVKKCFEKNIGIESFSCDNQFHFFPQLLHLLPNLKKLSLVYHSRHMKLDSLSKLQSLRHLTLHCFDENVNDILTDLRKNNILEELVLNDVAVDGNTFGLIKSFHNLRLLVVTAHNIELPSLALPAKLNTLKLGGFHIVDVDISTLVKQLAYLTDLQLDNCGLDRNGYLISDFDSMADLIVEELNEHADRQLNISITSFVDNSLEVSRAIRIRILYLL